MQLVISIKYLFGNDQRLGLIRNFYFLLEYIVEYEYVLFTPILMMSNAI